MKKLLKKLFDLLPKHIWPISVYYAFAEKENSLQQEKRELQGRLDDIYENLVTLENPVLSQKNNILFFHGGSGNHGCEAIIRTICKICGLKSQDVFLLSNNKHEDVKFGLDKAVGYIKSSILLATELEHHEFNVNSIAFSIGGDNYCYGSDVRDMLAAYNRLFLSKGVKTALIGCSIEPQALEDESVLNDLDSFELITARESITYNALLEKGISRNTLLIPDSAFSLNTEYAALPAGFDPDNTVGINVSNLIEKGSKLVSENIKVLIDYILNKTAFHIALIPHVVQDFNDDSAVLKDIFNQYGTSGRVILVEDRDCQTLKGYIARCKMFVGARTHATIAAYSNCVPTLVLGYSVKSKGIARDIFGTEQNYVVSIQDLKRADEFKEAFIWLCAHELEIRRHLQNMMPSYIERVSQLAECVSDLRSSNRKAVLPLADAKTCVGCGNCARVCPAGAASMITDTAGFSVRKIDYSKCTHCDACKAVCIMSGAASQHKSVGVFAAVNEDLSERIASSSGGIFVKLALQILDENGAVYGAAFDKNLTLRHIRVTDADGLRKLMGSKYLESALGNIFCEVESDVKSGKQVVFSGTPCQIKSLKLFLRKDYDNLLLVDVICHGVPAPDIFAQRVAHMEQKHKSKLTEVHFRDKRNGWEDFCVTYVFEDGQKISVSHRTDAYMHLFLLNKILRESCYNCPANNYRSGSDITLGDYWEGQRKHPNFDDNKGISAVLINSKKGSEYFKSIEGIKKEKTTLKWLEEHNSCLVKSVERPSDRDQLSKG